MNVLRVCGKLGRTPQAYYKKRKGRQRRAVDASLAVELALRERRLQPRLGVRKVYHLIQDDLAEAGVKIGRDRFFKICGERELLVPRLRAPYPHTTQSGHCLPVFGNRVKEQETTGPNQVWVSDLTYLRTGEGYLYLALITDAYSRKIVGAHVGDTLEAEGALAALDQALAGLPKEGRRPIHHSDQGCQYCCHLYVDRLKEAGLSISMTEANHCAENALAERVNGILKDEHGLGYSFATKAQARAAVEQSVWLYNHRRPHSCLGMEFPARVHAGGGKGRKRQRPAAGRVE